MTVTVVVGAQWGDEAKGKMVDLLCDAADVVARYNGGDNAGHTVVNQYGTFKLRLTPNGFSNPNTQCVIGPGVVLNLKTLLEEIDRIHTAGISLTGRLWISPRCHVVMPYHPVVEEIFESVKGGGATGTTRRGMGPVYADKVSYNGIRLADFEQPERLREKIRTQLAIKNPMFAVFGQVPLEAEQVIDEKLSQYERLKTFVREPFAMLQDQLRSGGNILLEGAQGTLLDNDWGTYPFVTASTTISGGAAAGLGIAPKWIGRVIGVAKAYTTRVGAGPMPTELLDETGSAIRDAGLEFGTVTGRARRCGWFDADLVRFTGLVNGYSELALTKLDVLDELPTLKIAVGYHHPAHGNNIFHYWDGDAVWLGEVEPVYIEMPGWQQSTRDIRDFDRLPQAAQAYIRKIEELVGVPVTFVSVGPDRSEIIEVR